MPYKVGDFVKITDRVHFIDDWKNAVGKVGRIVSIKNKMGVIFFEDIEVGVANDGHVLPLTDIRYFQKDEIEKIPEKIGLLHML